MFPTMHSPELIPIPTLMGGRESGLSSSFNTFVASRTSSADLTASSAWSSQSRGAFQKLIMQSPIYLSMVPELLSSVTFCVAVAPLTIAVAVALCVNVGTYTPKVSCHDRHHRLFESCL